MSENSIYIGNSNKREELFLKLANRHGLITGATGTGKTVTLQVLAEGFSSAGVPVFMADVKGDLSGISRAGSPKDFLLKRAQQIGYDDYGFEAFPTMFWDLFGLQGHPVRTTISEMGPLLISRLLGLTEAQEGALNIAFRIADNEQLLILDLKDLRALLSDLASRGAEITTDYGNVDARTIGAIQRRLVVLEEQGAENFFGEPALAISDLMRKTNNGRGYVNVLAADKLMQSPQLYATFLLWLLSELFEELPEIGDPEKPILVFFFDEAHLLFDDAPPGLVQKIEQVVRLIRSKGVGVYFVTQNPLDVPDSVLAQLGNRIQHALRAFTPRDQKAVKAAAQTFRQNPKFDTEETITQLGVGEALVSVLDMKGIPTIVERTLIRPPSSQLGPILPDERIQTIRQSPLYGEYEQVIDRESAFELLKKKAGVVAAEQAAQILATQRAKDDALRAKEEAQAAREEARRQAQADREARAAAASARRTDSTADRFVKNLASSVGRQVGSALIRGILGGLLKR